MEQHGKCAPQRNNHKSISPSLHLPKHPQGIDSQIDSGDGNGTFRHDEHHAVVFAKKRDAAHRTSCLELLAHELQTALAEAVATAHLSEPGIVPAYFAFFGLLAGWEDQVAHEFRVAWQC